MTDEHLSETWMWERAEELLKQADRMKSRFFQRGAPGDRRAHWEPPVDVYETPGELLVLVALPGVRTSCTQVRIEGSTVIVSGERAHHAACAEAKVRRMEIPHGRFRRRIELVVENLELAAQEWTDGCLLLRLRKRR